MPHRTLIAMGLLSAPALGSGCARGPASEPPAAGQAAKPTAAPADTTAVGERDQPEAAPEEVPAKVLPAPTEAERAAFTYFPKLPHTRLAQRTAPRWTVDGPELPSRAIGPWPYGPEDVPVLEQRDQALRVAFIYDRFVLLLWVDAGSVPVFTKAAPLRPRSDPTSGKTAFVELAPGVPVEVIQRAEDGVEVRELDLYWSGKSEDDRTHLHGWVSADAVGELYTDERFPYTPSSWDASVRGHTKVLDAPGGKPLFSLPSFESHDGSVPSMEAEWIEKKGRWVRIRWTDFCPGRVRVTGWVPEAKVERVEPRSSGGGCGGGSGGDVPGLDDQVLPATPIAEDTLLRSPEGDVVGWILGNTALATRQDGARIVPTSWGPLVVLPDVEP